MWILSTLLRTVVCFRVCVWDSVSNADGIAGGDESLPHARARVKQTPTSEILKLLRTSCPCARALEAEQPLQSWG